MIDNLFANIDTEMPQEMTSTLVDGENVRIERIVSKGHISAADFWYDQDQFEWVVILRGNATIQFEEGSRFVFMEIGGSVLLEPHQRHRVSYTDPQGPTVWLAVFFDKADAKQD